jgi:hypothetical protein
MKNLFVSPLLILLILFNHCSNNSRAVKSITWICLVSDKELPYKFELFDKNGSIIYDSSLLISGTGYRVNRYYKGKITSSILRINPGILELSEHEYDTLGNLISTLVKTDTDTSIFRYRNIYNVSNRLTNRLLYLNGNAMPVASENLYYFDSLLRTEITQRLNVDSFDTLRKKSYGYDTMGRVVYIVSNDYKQLIVDSTVIDFKERESKIFKSIRGGVYKLISYERILKTDSSEIEILQPLNDQKIFIRKKNVEYW